MNKLRDQVAQILQSVAVTERGDSSTSITILGPAAQMAVLSHLEPLLAQANEDTIKARLFDGLRSYLQVHGFDVAKMLEEERAR